MDKLPVGQLPDLQQSNNDDEIMVITNSEYNQLKKEKISDLITDFTSTNENNALTKGTDGKMFVTDFGNASNITEGTLPVSVLPNIPKELLPEIETTDLPVSGVTADTYAYPSSVTVNAQGQVTAIVEGTPSGSNANTDLSNITDAGKEVIKENSGGSGLEVGDVAFTQGAIDETKGLRRVLNGSVVTRNSNTQGLFDWFTTSVALNPDMATTEENWQSENTANGMCGKFVYTAESTTNSATLRLPNYPKYFIGNIAATAPVVGNGIVLGMTDGTIAGTYFIQIATGSETENNIINEIELNNPFFFGMYQYFEAEPNNLSWLKSAGQWNSKAVYPDYYNWLLQEKNNPSTLPADTANVEITGSLTNNNGVLSGFSESNYAEISQTPSNIESLEIVFKFTTGDDITTRQIIHGNTTRNMASPQLTFAPSEEYASLLEALIALEAAAWGSMNYSLAALAANTTYTSKVTWDNVSKNTVLYLKTEEGDFIQQSTVTQNSVYWTEPIRIGLDKLINPWLGSIDLNGCYIKINGELWWEGMQNNVRYSTEEYTDYDYVINTTDETFRLPLKTKGAPLTAEIVPVISNGYGLGLVASSGVHYLIDSGNGAGNILSGTEAEAPMLTGSAYSTSSSSSLNNGQVVGVSTNAAYSGLIADFTGINPEGLYLYFYVGDTIQNVNLINAGRLAEQINDIKAIPHIIESYRNGQSWYRVWSDGWCEQGGITNFEDTNKEVLFLKPYRDVNYTVTMALGVRNDTGIWGSEIACWDRTATGFTTRRANVLWHACGYLE